MELFGVVLSIPVAFVTSLLYCLLLVKVVSKSGRVSRWLRFASYIVLGLIATELVLLVTLGAVRARGLIGIGFYVAHVSLFFLGTPALANTLILPHRNGSGATGHKIAELFSRCIVATMLCTAFAFFLVLLQYSVSESLYGIDGEDGPYSKPPASTNLLQTPGLTLARSFPYQMPSG